MMTSVFQTPEGEAVIDGHKVDWMPAQDTPGAIGVWVDEQPAGLVREGGSGGFQAEAWFGGLGYSSMTGTFEAAVRGLYENAMDSLARYERRAGGA